MFVYHYHKSCIIAATNCRTMRRGLRTFRPHTPSSGPTVARLAVVSPRTCRRLSLANFARPLLVCHVSRITYHSDLLTHI